MLLTALPPLTANATSGSFTGGQVNRGYRLKISYSESAQNPKNNTSKVTATLYLVQDSTFSLYIGTRTATITINGTKTTISNIPAIRNEGGVTTKLGSASATVTHTSDGSKSISIAATFDMKATLSGTYYGTMSTSKTVALDKLDRTAPTVSLKFNSATASSVNLTATANANCDNWQYSKDGGSTWVSFGSEGTSNTFTISNLSGGTAYSIVARARKTKNNVTSAKSSAVTATTKPKPPGGLTVSAITQTSAKLSWNASTGAKSYKTYLNDTLKASGITTKSYTFTGLTANTSYKFGVRATCSSGDSSIASTSNYITLPNVPTGLSVTNQTDNSVDLSWSQNNGGNAATTTFEIYRDGTQIGTSTTTSYTDTTYENTDSSYTVCAVTSAGKSAQSSSVSVNHIPLSIALNTTNHVTYASITPSFTGGLNRDINYTSIKWAYGEQNAEYFADGGYTFTNSFAVLQNGTYTVYAKDTSGNEAVGTVVINGIFTKPTQGAFIQTFTDLSVDSIGLPIAFERTYSSMDNTNSIFGNGWSLNYAKTTHLSNDDENVQLVYLPDGTINYFYVSDGAYTGIRTQNKLTADGNKLILTTKDRIKYTYENNYLTRIEDANGNSVTIELNSSNLPVKITDSVGREYILSYNNNRITSITDPIERVFTYSYDENGNLIEQKSANGEIVNKFIYTNGLLTEITDSSDNTVCEVVYNTQNQVLNITDAEENTTYYLYEITDDGNIVIYESESEITSDNSDTSNMYNQFDQILADSDGLMYEYNSNGTISKITGESTDKTIVVYLYDDKGNVTSIVTKELLVDETTGEEIINERNIEEITYQYTYYDGTDCIASETEVIVTYTYDDESGNLTETDTQTITATYDSVGNLLSERTVHNDDDKTVTYTYGNNGLMLSETAEGVTTEYTYNSNGYVTNIKTVENGVENNISYSYNIIGLVLTKTENGLTYNYHYDNYGILTQTQFDIYTINYSNNSIENIYVNDTALVFYNYSGDKLNSETYANGQSLWYNYDSNGNVTEIFSGEKTDENKLFSYTYSEVDSDSEQEPQLLSVTDYKNNLRTEYTYETSEDDNETVNSVVFDISDETPIELYRYTTDNNSETLSLGGTTFTNTFTNEKTYITTENGEQEESGETNTSSIAVAENLWYNINTNDIDGVFTNSEIKNSDTTFINTNYTYDNKGRISSETTNGTTFTYTYDNNENITAISNGTNTVEYVYDEKSQLIRANDEFNNKTYLYEYDSRGNILSKKEYAYNTEEDLTELTPNKTATYAYNSNEGINWQDELATFNGNTLTYDENGNLTSYNGYTYTWSNGRQLSEISNGTNTYSYTYNDNGIRTSKTVNGVTTNYVTNNGTILAECNDSYSLNYWYDESGNPIGFIYKDKTLENSEEQVYIYTRNMQGDITGILDNTGTLVTQYTYDAWGSITSVSGTLSETIGTINGLRYRGYYYDNETGYYYLQSRYYNPEFSRFINADDINYIINSKDILELNSFIYCKNNSIKHVDPTGNAVKIAGYYWVALGVSISCSFNGIGGTFYALMMTNKDKNIYFYFSVDGASSIGKIKPKDVKPGKLKTKIHNLIDKICGKHSYDGNFLKSIKVNFTFSVFAVMCKNKKMLVKDFEGTCTTISAVIYHVLGYTSTANNPKTKKPFIKTFGIGFSTSKFDVSISTSRTFYITKAKWDFLGNAKNKLVSFIDALL